MRIIAGNWNSSNAKPLPLNNSNIHVFDLYGDMKELDPPHKNDEWVVTIPLEDIWVCETTEDMSKYGFKKIGKNRWQNDLFKTKERSSI